ncbi:aminoglycoside phosphotransferase family protein [Brachybacterium phenoliresistens]|uniref:phosphotransferase family protein n=1 Tax=Brachybacterium phenoliresistens TaxID=396014 RepID=UPI0031D583FF
MQHIVEPWVREVLGPRTRIAAITPLTGGLSQAMYRLDLTGADAPAVVLRRWPEDGPWPRECARREAAALELLAGGGIGAPGLIAADPEGERTGRPSTLMTCLPGRGVLDPEDVPGWLEALAARLAAIHDLPPGPDLEPCPRHADMADPRRRAWMAGLPEGAAALDLAVSADDPRRPLLAHGDYQHFNVLWTGSALTGVVDWTGCGVADAGRDVGHCMLNLTVLHDAARAWSFLGRYQALTGTRVDPAWLMGELLDFSPAWEEFIPIQVGGRAPVDPAGMRARVEELIVQVLRAAG